MTEINPYQSPEAEAVPDAGASGGMITSVMFEALKGASPWLRFMGIIGFIGAGVMVLVGIIFLATGGFAAGALANVEDASAVGTGAFGSVLTGMLGGAVGFIYIALGMLYFFPARWTYLFGAKIRNYTVSGSAAELEAALNSNKSLWKFNGVITIVGIASIPLFVIAAAIIAVAAM